MIKTLDDANPDVDFRAKLESNSCLFMNSTNDLKLQKSEEMVNDERVMEDFTNFFKSPMELEQLAYVP